MRVFAFPESSTSKKGFDNVRILQICDQCIDEVLTQLGNKEFVQYSQKCTAKMFMDMKHYQKANALNDGYLALACVVIAITCTPDSVGFDLGMFDDELVNHVVNEFNQKMGANLENAHVFTHRDGICFHLKFNFEQYRASHVLESSHHALQCTSPRVCASSYGMYLSCFRMFLISFLAMLVRFLYISVIIFISSSVFWTSCCNSVNLLHPTMDDSSWIKRIE